MGSNKEGRLGINERRLEFSSSPCLVEHLSTLHIVSISCGEAHSAAISNEGLAFAWGEGKYGALGDNSTVCAWAPIKVHISSSVKVRAVSCGGRHTAFLIENTSSCGNVVVCGAGEAGQLGTGRQDRELTPVGISIKNIRQVACGASHTLFLNSVGSLYATGGNAAGQLGTGDQRNVSFPVKVKYFEAVAVEKIACGGFSGCLTEGGEVYVWGSTGLWECAVPYKLRTSRARVISIGRTVGAVVDMNGTVHAWGNNSKGELGQGNYRDYGSVVTVGGLLGKNVREVVCGGSFCLGMGEDVTLHSRTNKPARGQREQHETVLQAKNRVQDAFCQVEMREIARLQQLNSDASKHNRELEDSLRTSELKTEELIKQLNFYKTNSLHKTHELEKTQQAMSEQQKTISELTLENQQWEDSYNKLLDENHSLELGISELEAENTSLCHKIETGLEQRTREYRERTQNILFNRQQPAFCEQQSQVHTVNRQELSEEQQRRIGRRAAGGLQRTAYDSPLKDLHLSSPVLQTNSTYSPSSRKRREHTPSKQEIQARISELRLKHAENVQAIHRFNQG